jgi:hypothetical protein
VSSRWEQEKKFESYTPMCPQMKTWRKWILSCSKLQPLVFPLTLSCKTLQVETWCILMAFRVTVPARGTLSPLLPHWDWPTPAYQRKVATYGGVVSDAGEEVLLFPEDGVGWAVHVFPELPWVDRLPYLSEGLTNNATHPAIRTNCPHGPFCAAVREYHRLGNL